MLALDQELTTRVFLEGEGQEEGEKDRETWKKLQKEEIGEDLVNLSRWVEMMRKRQEKH